LGENFILLPFFSLKPQLIEQEKPTKTHLKQIRVNIRCYHVSRHYYYDDDDF